MKPLQTSRPFKPLHGREMEDLQVIVARLDERLQSMQCAISQLADNQKHLTLAIDKMTETAQRLNHLENELAEFKVETRDSLASIRTELSEHRARREETKSHALFEIAKLIGAGLVGVILAKMGVK